MTPTNRHGFAPAKPTTGSVHCPNHVAVARPHTDPIEWYCRLCEKDLVMVTGEGLR